MRAITVFLIAAFLAAPAAAGSWSDLDKPFYTGGSMLTASEAAAKNLGPKPFGVMTAYSGSNFVTLPDGRHGILVMGGGHLSWGGNEVHFWHHATGLWERLTEPTEYDTTLTPDPNDDPAAQRAWDFDDDGHPNVAPGMHLRSGVIVAGNYIVACGSGAYPTGDSSWATNETSLWVLEYDPDPAPGDPNYQWKRPFVDQLVSNKPMKCWADPAFPDSFFALHKDGVVRADLSTGVLTEIMTSSGGVGSGTRGAYGSVEWWPGQGAVFLVKRSGGSKAVKIVVDSNGENAVLSQFNINADAVDPANPEFNGTNAGWGYYPPGDYALATMGAGDVWELKFNGSVVDATLVHASPGQVANEPWIHSLESSPSWIMANDFDYNPQTQKMVGVLHDPETGPWEYDPAGSGTPPPDPECDLIIDSLSQGPWDCPNATQPLIDQFKLDTGPQAFDAPVFLKNGGTVANKRFNRVAKGKGAVTVAARSTSPTVVSNIYCEQLANRDRNAACVRDDGKGGATIERMTVVDSDQGYLGCKGGTLDMRDSTFVRVGNDPHRRFKASHGIYARNCEYAELTNLMMLSPTGGNLVQIGGNGIVKGGVYECTGPCSYAFKMVGDAPGWLFQDVTIRHAGEGNEKVFWYNNPGWLVLEDSLVECAPGHRLTGGPVDVKLINSEIVGCV